LPQVAAYFAAEYLAAEIAWAAVETLTLDIVGFQAVSAASTFAIAAGASQLLGRGATSSLADQVRGQQINFRSSTAPRNLIYGRYLVGGPIIFAKAGNVHYDGTTRTEGPGENAYLHLVIALADHGLDAIEAVYFGDEPLVLADPVQGGQVIEGRYAQRARFRYALEGGAPYTELVEESLGAWTAAHRLTGISSLYARLQFDPSVYSGIPTIRALVRGKKVFDPRIGLTSFSSNPALCIRDYLLSAYGLGATLDEIDEASFIAAANLCDEPVQAAAITQPRYALHGVVSSETAPREVLGAMLSTCGGQLIFTDGRYRLKAASFEVPSRIISADDLRGAVSIQTRLPRRELFNRVSGVIADAQMLYTPTEYPAVASTYFRARDGGDELSFRLDLGFTTDRLQAQRLAKMALMRSRQAISVALPCKPACMGVAVGDVVSLTLDALGWQLKPFRVVGWGMTPELGVDLQLQEDAASSYAWEADDAVDDAPDSSLSLLGSMAAPTGLEVTSTAAIQPDGTTHPAAQLSWHPITSALVTSYEVHYQPSGDDGWQIAQTMASTMTLSGVFLAATTYRFKVRALYGSASARRVGPFSETVSSVIAKDLIPPQAPTDLSAIAGHGSISLRWKNPSDPDLLGIDVYEATSDDRATAVAIARVSANAFTRAGLAPSVTRYYWLRAVDDSGNVGPWSQATGVGATTLPALVDGKDGQNGTNGVDGKPGRDGIDGRPGRDGVDGAPGRRGSVTVALNVGVTYWSDASANAAISGAGFGVPLNRDIVTLYNAAGAFSETRFYDQGSWLALTSYINGNLLVSGTLSASKLSAGSILSSTAGTEVSINGPDGSDQSAIRIRKTNPVLGPALWIDDKSSYVAYYPMAVSSNGEAAIFYSYGTTGSYVVQIATEDYGSPNIPIGLDVRGNFNGPSGQFISRAISGTDKPAARFLGASSQIRLGMAGYAFYINAGVGGPFTGAHDGLMLNSIKADAGDILTDDQLVRKKSISDTICSVTPSTEPAKAALGVLNRREPLSLENLPAALVVHEISLAINDRGDQMQYPVPSVEALERLGTHDVVIVNALGEGQVNVCGEGGAIAPGDLIQTSTMPGKGMRQASNIVQSFSVARARESAQFDSPNEEKQIACIYLCG